MRSHEGAGCFFCLLLDIDAVVYRGSVRCGGASLCFMLGVVVTSKFPGVSQHGGVLNDMIGGGMSTALDATG